MFRVSWTICFCFLFLTSTGVGQRDEQPVSAKMKELLLIQQAEKGDVHAQSEVVRKAEMGDPQAESALGDNYEYGIWVAKDHAQALRWYRKAAEHGDTGAREIIGNMYFDGKGIKQDFAEAARWYGCPKPSEAILASCAETSYEKLPQGVVNLLREMKCEVAKNVLNGGSNYDEGNVVNLSGAETPAYEVCCSESPHGPCGAVVIGRIGQEWKNLTAKEGLMGFSGACNGFVVLDSQHNGFHDVCLPDQCSTATPTKGDRCSATIWQFGNGRYRSVANTSANPTR
jgi:uncharacterized protein